MASLSQINIKFFADLKEFSTQMQNAERQIGKMGKNLQNVGKTLTIGVTAPILGLAAGAVKAAADLETLETSLAVMTGSAESGKQALKDIADFTAKTPFQLDQVGSAAKQLLAFGFTLDEIKPKLKVLGDVAAGSGNQIGEVAQIFGQVSAAGKLTGERFNQLQERAIPIGSAIAKTMGIAESSVKDFISKGLVGFEEFETAFNSLAQDGGLFTDAMEKQSQTLSGLFSTFKDNVSLASGELGVAIAESINLKGVVDSLTTSIQNITTWFKNLSPETKKIIVVVSGLAAAVGPLLATLGFAMTTIVPGLITAFSGLAKVLTLVIAKVSSLNTAMLINPITLTVAAVSSLVYAFTVLIQKITPVVSKLKTFFNLMKSGGDPTRFVQLQTQSYADALVDEAKAQEEANKVMEEANKIIKSVSSSLTDLSKQTPVTVEIRTKRTEEITGATPKGLDLQEDKLLNEGYGGVDLLTDDLKLQGEEFTKEQERLLSASIDFSNRLSETIQQAAVDFVGGIGEMVGGLISGEEDFQTVGARLLSGFANILIQFGKLVIAAGVASEAFSKAITNPFGGGFGAIAAGAALVAIGTAMKNFSKNVTAFADGGIVSGPTLALVGEYSGASSNPEVIAPLDKLKSMLQPAVVNVEVSGTLKADGRDMKLVLGRTDQQYYRLS